MKSSATGLEAGEAARPDDLARHDEESLLAMTETLEQRHGYVPREAAMEFSRKHGVKLARIYEVITFHHYFKLQPPGAHHHGVQRAGVLPQGLGGPAG